MHDLPRGYALDGGARTDVSGQTDPVIVPLRPEARAIPRCASWRRDFRKRSSSSSSSRTSPVLPVSSRATRRAHGGGRLRAGRIQRQRSELRAESHQQTGFDPVMTSHRELHLLDTWVLLTHPRSPRKQSELIRVAKASPGKIDTRQRQCSPHHVVMELFKRATGTDFHHVPYRGAAQAVTDVVAGQIPVNFSAIAFRCRHKQGRARALAVPSEQRSPPCLIRLRSPSKACATSCSARGSVSSRRKAPPGCHRSAEQRTFSALSVDTVRERLSALSLEPRSSTPEELGRITRDGLARVSKVITEAGIKAD